MRLHAPLLIAAASASLLAACAATPGPEAAATGTAIPYAVGGGIRDWHADDSSGIYVRDSANRWYYARFTGPCPGVVRDQQIAFEPDTLGRFDELTRVRTRTETCAVASIQPAEAPAAKGGPKR